MFERTQSFNLPFIGTVCTIHTIIRRQFDLNKSNFQLIFNSITCSTASSIEEQNIFHFLAQNIGKFIFEKFIVIENIEKHNKFDKMCNLKIVLFGRSRRTRTTVQLNGLDIYNTHNKHTHRQTFGICSYSFHGICFLYVERYDTNGKRTLSRILFFSAEKHHITTIPTSLYDVYLAMAE